MSLLLAVPWWVGVATGVIVYALVGWVLPLALGSDDSRGELARALQLPALVALSVCLIVSVVIALRARERQRHFAVRNGVADLRRMGTRDFLTKVSDAFRRRGYEVATRRVRGVDLVLTKDARCYLVRCKQWKVFNVGTKPLVELNDRVNEEAAAGAFYISAGVFTRDARLYAAEMNIELIGGTALIGFIQTDAEPSKIAPYREPVFLSNTALTIPVCPACGNPMVRRVAKYGKNAGEEFWGCGQYPHCRGTR